MVSERDEGRHDKTEHRYWQESIYFNFVDDRSGVYGFTRIGFRVNEGQADGILFVIKGRDLWYAYPLVNQPLKTPWDQVRFPEDCRVGRLAFQMEEPFKRWRLKLSGPKNNMDLLFECFTPVYDYNAEVRSLPENVAAQHYEQSGWVRGRLDLRGQQIEIAGTGQRDHSWGVRDWAGIEGWRWITAQFSDKFSFNVFSVTDQGREHTGGFVFDGRDNAALDHAQINLDLAADGAPRAGDLVLTDARGRKHAISAQVFHVTPLRRHRAFIKETFAHFQYQDLKGCGVIERLHQPRSRLDDLRFIAQAATYAWRGLWNK